MNHPDIIPPEYFIPEKKSNPKIWLHIFEGRLCEKRATEHPGFVRYESTFGHSKGRTWYIKEYDYILGYLTGLQKVEKETLEGKRYHVLHFTFNNGSDLEAILEVPLKSDFTSRFAKCCENINFSKPLQVSAFIDRKTRRNAIVFRQLGEIVPQKYTMEQPNGLPQWERDPVTGEYDTRAYWHFLFNIIGNHAIPEIAKTAKIIAANQLEEDSKPAEEKTAVDLEDDGDIPF